MTMTMTMIVRIANVADAAGIAAMHVASWQWAYAGLISQDYLDSLSVHDRTQTWERNLSQPPAPGGVTTLVAEMDDRIIGFASIGPSRDDDADPRTQELWGTICTPITGVPVMVTPCTLRSYPNCAPPDQRVCQATLWVLAGNKRARRFYEQHGWSTDGAEKTDRRGDVRLDEVRYRRTLSAHPDA